MQIKSFRVDLGAAGFNEVEVDGEDITNRLAGLDIVARPGQVTQLVLYMLPQVGTVSGEAGVEEMKPSDHIKWEMLDLEAIGEEAMNRQGWDSDAEEKPLAAHFIDVIKEHLDAQTA